jgi:hypothetical protein
MLGEEYKLLRYTGKNTCWFSKRQYTWGDGVNVILSLGVNGINTEVFLK